MVVSYSTYCNKHPVKNDGCFQWIKSAWVRASYPKMIFWLLCCRPNQIFGLYRQINKRIEPFWVKRIVHNASRVSRCFISPTTRVFFQCLVEVANGNISIPHYWPFCESKPPFMDVDVMASSLHGGTFEWIVHIWSNIFRYGLSHKIRMILFRFGLLLSYNL